MATYIPLEARLALEYWRASGERTPERLRALTEHFCETNAIPADCRAYIHSLAQAKAGFQATP